MLFETQIVLCMLVILCFSMLSATAVAMSGNTNLAAIGKCVYVLRVCNLSAEL